jgi:hypothetical protein
MKKTIPLLLTLVAMGCSTPSGPLAQVDTQRVRDIAARHMQEHPKVTIPADRLEFLAIEAYFTGSNPQGVIITVIYKDTSSHRALERNEKGEPKRESLTTLRVSFNGNGTSVVVNEVAQEFNTPEWKNY